VAGVEAADGTVDDTAADHIVGIDGRRFSWYDDPSTAMVGYVHRHAGTLVTLRVRGADGTERDVPVTLRGGQAADEAGALGVGGMLLRAGAHLDHTIPDAIVLGASRAASSVAQTVGALGGIVTNLTAPQVTGPVGLTAAVGTIRTESPPEGLLYLMALLAVNLGVVNALPIPPLDGGRGFMMILRAIAGKRWSARIEGNVYRYGWVGLMLFIGWVTFHDMVRLVTGA
jgi:regulator of sigma E protease